MVLHTISTCSNVISTYIGNARCLFKISSAIGYLLIKYSLKKGERVELRGFGTWSTHIQKARISRNPKTGEKVDTPEKKTIHFKFGKELFDKINNEKK